MPKYAYNIKTSQPKTSTYRSSDFYLLHLLHHFYLFCTEYKIR